SVLPVLAVIIIAWLVQLPQRSRLLALGSIVVIALIGIVGLLTRTLEQLLINSGLRDAVVTYALNGIGHWRAFWARPVLSEQGRDLLSNHADRLVKSFWGIFGWYAIPLGGN